MIYNDFLSELAQLDTKWHLANGDRIRCERNDCPITAVARAHGHPHETAYYDSAARDINLGEDNALQIALCSDDDDGSTMRADLLKACKLTAQPSDHNRLPA